MQIEEQTDGTLVAVLTVRVPAWMKRRLKDYATVQGWTLSHTVVLALDEFYQFSTDYTVDDAGEASGSFTPAERR